MNSSKSRDWVSIGTNLGILAGLILVAVQINQSNEMIRGSSYQMWVASNLELNVAATQSDLSRTLRQGNLDSAGLGEDTFIQFAMWNFGFMQMVPADLDAADLPKEMCDSRRGLVSRVGCEPTFVGQVTQV